MDDFAARSIKSGKSSKIGSQNQSIIYEHDNSNQGRPKVGGHKVILDT
jgi:hypothetical protein